ncbi:MAG: ATP-dependent DNA helicase RecG, partial [Proteobacteria bacterium]|nr:ATP-dependent DNA helicase RecG [Pseudomonadota bacterium]
MSETGAVRWPAKGSRQASLLARLDIHRPEDLILHLPLRYEDETRLTPIGQAQVGASVQIEAEVLSCEVTRPRRQLLARLRDEAGSEIVARWINFYP